MRETLYFVGIEGFHARYSMAVLANMEGYLLAVARRPRSLQLHTVNPADLANHLKELLLELFEEAGLNIQDCMEQTSVCIGMAGVTYAYDRRLLLPNLIRRKLDLTFGKLVCTGDAEIVFLSHAQAMPGSLIVSHTGSVAYAVGKTKDGLTHYRRGGWGPALGDEGSGYWIGREALRSILREHDERRPPSVLWDSISSWLLNPTPNRKAWDDASDDWNDTTEAFQHETRHGDNMDARTLLYSFIHRLALSEDDDATRCLISGLVIPVMEAAYRNDAPDPSARRIVEQAMEHLAQQHQMACQAAVSDGIQCWSPLVLYGGVLDHNPMAALFLRNRIESMNGVSIGRVLTRSSDVMRPVLGALLYALGGSEQDDLRVAPDNVIAHLRRQCSEERWQRKLADA